MTMESQYDAPDDLEHKAAPQLLISLLADVPRLLQEWETRERNNSSLFAGIRQRLDRLAEETARLDQVLGLYPAALETVSQQMRILSESHFSEHIVLPLANQLLSIYVLIEEHRVRWGVTSEVTAEAVTSLLPAVQAMVANLLGHYGVELLNAAEGTLFDPATMQVMNPPLTAPRQGPLFVARTTRVGCRLGSRVIRFQFVDVTTDNMRQGVLPQLYGSE